MNISSIDLERMERRRMWRSNAIAVAVIGGLLALNGLVTGWDKEATEKVAARPANQSQKRIADTGTVQQSSTTPARMVAEASTGRGQP